jgi:hypothetical protein
MVSKNVTFKDNVFHCEKCGAKQTLKLPMTMQQFTLKSQQFIKAHEKCATGEKK